MSSHLDDLTKTLTAASQRIKELEPLVQEYHKLLLRRLELREEIDKLQREEFVLQREREKDQALAKELLAMARGKGHYTNEKGKSNDPTEA